MISLKKIIRHLKPDARPWVDFTITVDRLGGEKIQTWNKATIGEEPTYNEIEAARLNLAKLESETKTKLLDKTKECAADAAALKSSLPAFLSGTATNAQMQRAIAYLLK